MQSHYTVQVLECYLRGNLNAMRRMICSSHLEKCSKCRALLLNLQANEIFLQDLRTSILNWKKIHRLCGKTDPARKRVRPKS